MRDRVLDSGGAAAIRAVVVPSLLELPYKGREVMNK